MSWGVRYGVRKVRRGACRGCEPTQHRESRHTEVMINDYVNVNNDGVAIITMTTTIIMIIGFHGTDGNYEEVMMMTMMS